ncbi:MAG: hypothetical protein MUP98_17360 [Candidatus Aminicenantes bacterium]|nr:hypothetical protein [Candidatus Aminicenantes bacterium]
MKKWFLIGLLILFFPLFSAALNATSEVTDSLSILISPQDVKPGDVVKVLLVHEENMAGINIEIETVSPQTNLKLLSEQRREEFPSWVIVACHIPSEGLYRISVTQNGERLFSTSFDVASKSASRKESPSIWSSTRQWSRDVENLYSAWLESLFLDDEEGAYWGSLQDVLRDSKRNFLYNHLDLDEDNKLVMEPDCADNPYFLRAYFSWKLGLPFGFHKCDWGGRLGVPLCTEWVSNQEPREYGDSDIQAFQTFLRSIMNTVHSGSARTALADNTTDLYPVKLTKKHLKPGVVFADPYGHTLNLVRWIPQTSEQSGKLIAVDAQPNGTISLKRFWQGTFLFTNRDVVGEPGFKAFRPIVETENSLRLLSNAEIADHPDYGNFSTEQNNLDQNSFYDTIDGLINPQPQDPVSVFRELHEAVFEQLKSRQIAIEKSEEYMKKTGNAVIPMPSGSGIFQTVGPWEDYSTPSRDMRVLIALDVLLDFPEKILRNPQVFQLSGNKTPQAVNVELVKLHNQLAQEYTISYSRSDGERQELTLAEIIDRMKALEMGYNPNDCMEIRWGAPKGSEESASCSRRAPADQIEKMLAYRRWFRDRVRPIR